MNDKIAVKLATLESHNHIVGDIERGVKLYERGGVVETKLNLGKSASVTTTVTEQNTAKAVGGGNLDVFATPMMIKLMERAACECLADGLEDGQTSVGTQISIEHTAAEQIKVACVQIYRMLEKRDLTHWNTVALGGERDGGGTVSDDWTQL